MPYGGAGRIGLSSINHSFARSPHHTGNEVAERYQCWRSKSPWAWNTSLKPRFLPYCREPYVKKGLTLDGDQSVEN